jgi:hypothetical protein
MDNKKIRTTIYLSKNSRHLARIIAGYRQLSVSKYLDNLIQINYMEFEKEIQKYMEKTKHDRQTTSNRN